MAEYIYIPHVTHAKQRTSIPKAQRGSCKLAVALLPGVNEVVVKSVTGSSSTSGHAPTTRFSTKDGKVAVGFTSAEYIAFLREVLEKCQMRSRRRRHLVLVQDRDPAHLTPEVASFLQSEGVDVMTLPPHSPDLDPLDYCVFGHTKTWLRKRVAEMEQSKEPLSFDQICGMFMTKLKSLDAEVQTAGFVSRMERVINAKGGHIET